MSKLTLYLAITFLGALAGAAWAQEVSTENGLGTVTYETPEGQIRFNYPQTLHAGDRFTGTVVAEPKGESEAEKTEFADKISGYVVEVNDSVQATTRAGSFQWQLPEALSALTLVLRDSEGNALSRTDAPIQSGPGQALGKAIEASVQYRYRNLRQVRR